MGKKYIIEVEDKPYQDECGVELWKVKTINCYISKSELEKLEEYKEPHHDFKVGDVCIPKAGAETKEEFVITRITPDVVSIMWADGTHELVKTSSFVCQAIFVRHSMYFEMFLAGGLK